MTREAEQIILLDRDDEPAEGGGEVGGGTILVPDGEYVVRYLDYETGNYWGTPKVVVHFVIVESDNFEGSPVDRFYNATRLTSPPGRFGNYVAPACGDLIREFNRLTGSMERADRISFAKLKGKRIQAEVKRVQYDYCHEPLAEADQYSRISRLIRTLPDEDWQ